MAAPLIQVTGATLLDAIIVVAMVVVEVFLLLVIVPRRGPAPSLARMTIGSSALLGSAGTLMAAVQAFMSSNLDTYTIVLFAFNFMMVAPPGLWVIAVIVFEDRTIDPKSWFWPVAIVAMATLAEVLMGLLFVVSDGSALDLPTVLAGTLASPWYLWSMVGAMVALVLWVPLPAPVRVALLGLAGSGVVAPWVVVDPVTGAVLMGLVMAAAVGASYRSLRASLGVVPDVARVLLGVLAAFIAMTVAGLGVAAASDAVPAQLLFGAVMSAVMVAEFLYLVREGIVRAPRVVAAPKAPGPVPAPVPRDVAAGAAAPSRD